MIKFADVIVDLQAGDTGKGKVAHALCKSGEYTHVVRYNGGGNAGHTIYHNGEKIVTHFIPCGVLYGIKSIIGPGCVVNVSKLFEEIQTLRNAGIETKGHLFIDKRVHIITDDHINEDSKDIQIGTTKTGNGPCYRDKYYRKGIRAKDVELLLSSMIIDTYEEFHGREQVSILFEGAQGFELDIDWGDYPYVTSSHCTVGSAILNGVPPHSIRNIYGVAKAYRTYVGQKSFEGDSPFFELIRMKGEEFGATTGRPRQINWIDINDLAKAININGVTNLIINKIDVLDSVGVFKAIVHGQEKTYESLADMQFEIIKEIRLLTNKEFDLIFSTTPYTI
jgi:adenylosuccinate synthase